MSHPFEVGKTYRNRVGEYVVQAIDGDRMTIQYAGGSTLETSASIQARIWENIHFEEQMAREDERQRLAQEARLEARRRTTRARQAKKRPSFSGFQKEDLEPKQRGIAWATREQLGRVLAYRLNQQKKGNFGQMIVPRKSAVHVARQEAYSRDARDTNAALFVAVRDRRVSYGYHVGKPDGKESPDWPWTALMTALAHDQQLRDALRKAMADHDLRLDIHTMQVSYGRVARVSVDEEGFLWEQETADQIATQPMEWDGLVEYLQTVAPEQRCDLYIQKHLSESDALKAGASVSEEIGSVFEALLPVYDASVGA